MIRPIKGKPKDTTLDYSEAVTSEDEVESLFELLKEIKIHHPDAQGVSTGAIASTYQKNRVEKLCDRLGLTSIALLWGRDQKELLSEMVDKGVVAILIKVACYGLTKDHIGKTLNQMKSTLFKLSDDYGVHSCGEGGEFESLVLDCPLFKQHIMM